MHPAATLDQDIIAEATAWRRHLHAHPETAFEEEKTAAFIAERLSEMGIEVHRGLAGTGVVGTLTRGDGKGVIGLRADMDALFIEEDSDLPWRSTVPGKMHACGHDGHCAMLLGAAAHLARHGDFNGTVRFIFQPAEETGDERCGGNLMVQEGLFEKFPVDAVFGMHNFPSVPEGVFLMRSGSMLASIDTFEFHITSALAHPSTQHLVPDPLLTAAAIVQDLHAWRGRHVSPTDPVVMSITQFQCGNPADRQSVHVAPQLAVVRGTLYTHNDAVRDQFEEAFGRIVRCAAEAAGTGHHHVFERGYPVLYNRPEPTALAARVATAVSGADKVITDVAPIMAAEDFAFMAAKVPGCYVALGGGVAGEAEPKQLHHARYEFNDAILPVGIKYWATLAGEFLGQR